MPAAAEDAAAFAAAAAAGAPPAETAAAPASTQLAPVAELPSVHPSHLRGALYAGGGPKTPGSTRRGLRQRRKQRERHRSEISIECCELAPKKAEAQDTESTCEDGKTALDRLPVGSLKPQLHQGQTMRQPWWQRLMWWPGVENGAPPGPVDAAEIPAVPSFASSAAPNSPAPPFRSRLGSAGAQLGPPGSAQSCAARSEQSYAMASPDECMPELLGNARAESRRRPRTGAGGARWANTYPTTSSRPGTSSVRPGTGSVKLPSTAESSFGRAFSPSGMISGSAAAETAETANQAEASLAALLEDLPQQEKAEACIALPELAGNDRLIVRGKIDEVMRKRKELSSRQSGKYRHQLESLKMRQATWRKNHEALVRKKREWQNIDWSGEEFTSDEEKVMGPMDACTEGIRPAGSPPGSGRPGAQSPNGSIRPAMSMADQMAAMGRGKVLRKINTQDNSDQGAVVMRGNAAAQVDGKDAQTEREVTSPRQRGQTRKRTVSVSSNLDGQSSSRPGTAAGNEERRRSIGGGPANTPRIARGGGKGRANLVEDQKSGESLDFGPTYSNRSDAKGSSNDGFFEMQKHDLGLCKPGTLLAKQRGGNNVLDKSDFNYAVTVAKKHNLPVDQVKTILEEFNRIDINSDGFLCEKEFLQLVRLRANLPSDDPVPKHLRAKFWEKLDNDKSGNVDFEEFLLWSINVAYSEEMLVSDPQEREMRALARKNGLNLTDVERIKKAFDKFDSDMSGVIDEDEFKEVLITLMKVKNPNDVSAKKMKRFWLEVDADRSGEVNFEEFLLWYFNFFNNGNGYY